MRRLQLAPALLLAGTALWTITALPPACAAQSHIVLYDLPEEDLGAALRALALASGEAVIAPADLVEGRRAPRLRGRYQTADALARLLAGSGLEARKVGDAFVIQRADGEVLPGADSIVVTGTRVRGRAPAGTAVTTLDRDAIEQSGYPTVTQLLQALPQNFGGGPNEATLETNRGNAGLNQTYGSSINLRGLGSTATLVLLAGERPPMGGFSGIFTDISMIPASALERIDILPDGASALYGSDAIAGVVNLVPRARFEGAETSLRAGLGKGYREAGISQLLGTRWGGGRLLLAYEFYGRDHLAAAERAFVSEDLRAFGLGDYRAGYANPGTIVAGGQSYAIPAGGGTPVAGTSNRRDAWYRADALPAQARHSLYGAASQTFGALELYANTLFGERRHDARMRAYYSASPRTVTPANPFYLDPSGKGQTVQLRYSFVDDLGPETSRGVSRALGATAGVRLGIARWQLDLHATYGSQYERWGIYNLVNSARLGQALTDPDPATAYNLFATGPATSPATIERVRGSILSSGLYRMRALHLRADGPLLTLPGGTLNLATGAELRDEQYRADPTRYDYSTLKPVSQPAPPFTRPRRIAAAYAELSAPLVSPAMGVPGINRLDLSAAVRSERYSDFGLTTNPRLGVSWQVAPGLALRGTWGTSFRAPNLNDLRQDPTTIGYFAIALADPQAPGGTSNALILRGNDPDLGPERATSWTLGIDLAPAALAGLTARATLFHTRYRDRIASPSAALLRFLIDRALYRGIIDETPDPAEIAAYFASPHYLNWYNIPATAVTKIVDARTQNLSAVRQSGLDFELGWKGELGSGTLDTGVAGTWLLRMDQAYTASAPLAPVLGTTGYPVSLRLRGRAGYDVDRLHVGIAGNFVGRYRNTSLASPQRVAPWATFDLNFAYRLPERSPLGGWRAALAITNVLGAGPPRSVNNLGLTTIGYDPENASPLGRVFSLQLTHQW